MSIAHFISVLCLVSIESFVSVSCSVSILCSLLDLVITNAVMRSSAQETVSLTFMIEGEEKSYVPFPSPAHLISTTSSTISVSFSPAPMTSSDPTATNLLSMHSIIEAAESILSVILNSVFSAITSLVLRVIISSVLFFTELES